MISEIDPIKEVLVNYFHRSSSRKSKGAPIERFSYEAKEAFWEIKILKHTQMFQNYPTKINGNDFKSSQK